MKRILLIYYTLCARRISLHSFGILLIGTLFFQISCIDELEIPLAKDEKLVINGQFNNSPGLRQLTVVAVVDSRGVGDTLSASGVIYKNGVESVSLLSDSANNLRLPPTYRIEAGAEYFAEIRLPDGRTYRSKAQVVEPVTQTDFVSFKVLDQNPDEVDPTLPVIPQGIEFFAHLFVPELSEGPKYYRWVVDEAYSFIESNKTDTCYVRESIYTNVYSLYSNTSPDSKVGQVIVPIMKQGLDKSFRYQHYINAYLHTIDKTTFEYYQKVERIVGSSGTIYDEVPGPVEGNVTNIDNPDERVGGLIEFFLADTTRLRLKGELINTNIRRQCDDIPGGGPCPPFSPCQCLNCDTILGKETLTPPFYWVD